MQSLACAFDGRSAFEQTKAHRSSARSNASRDGSRSARAASFWRHVAARTEREQPFTGDQAVVNNLLVARQADGRPVLEHLLEQLRDDELLVVLGSVLAADETIAVLLTTEAPLADEPPPAEP